MRFPRLRFSVRLLMAIVAVVAATLSGFVEYRRLTRMAAEYRAKAEDHAGVEKTLNDHRADRAELPGGHLAGARAPLEVVHREGRGRLRGCPEPKLRAGRAVSVAIDGAGPADAG